jgi:hypothetical protein
MIAVVRIEQEYAAGVRTCKDSAGARDDNYV